MKGFTLMEVLIAMFLFVVATIAIAGVSALVAKTSFRVGRQVVAQAIANDKIETIQAMSYGMIGRVPAGATQQSNTIIEGQGGVEYVETITQNQQVYTVTTDVVPVDDPINGNVTSGLNMNTADYKTVRIQVDPDGAAVGSVNAGVVSSATTIANWPPQTCVPGDPTACQIDPFPTPPPTFTFNFKGEPVQFINGLSLFTRIPAAGSGLYLDDPTGTKACNVKGYAGWSSYTAGSWGSPSNNYNARYNGSDFITSDGNTPTNDQISSVTCSNPYPTAQCTYKIPCPSSGRCSDATLPRGYTPTGTQYPSTCKSPADCNSGSTCDTVSGQCVVSSLPKYEYTATEDVKSVGIQANCTLVKPSGAQWILRKRQDVRCSSGVCNQDVCLWRRNTANNYEYQLTTKVSSCGNVSGFTLKTSGVEYCLYEKTNGIVSPDLTLAAHITTGSSVANCAINNVPGPPFTSFNAACVYKPGSYCNASLCLWKNTNICPLPANFCAIVEYNAGDGTLPDLQGWTKNDTTSDPDAIVGHFLATDNPKYISLTDHSTSGYVNYTYPNVDPSVLMDQDWTYEITMRVQQGTKNPLNVGPIGLIASDGLRYVSSIFEASKFGALGTVASPYSYIMSQDQDTTGSFRTYKIIYHKFNPGITDDAYDISIDGVNILTGVRRSDSYVPAVGDFAKGFLFGLWSTQGQGVVDISRVSFKAGTCY